MREKRVVISGGGTGGHLYPALVLGRQLVELEPGLRLTYVGTHRVVEKQIMEEHGVHFIPMRIEGLKGRGLKSLGGLVLLPLSFIQSLVILLRTKPDLVIGVGGFSAGPIVLLASWLRIPTLILEQNALPGFTNRLLARWTRRAIVAFDTTLPYFKDKGVRLGNPVREDFYKLRPKSRTNRLAVLVFGGSQGAHILNQNVTAALPLLAPYKGRVEIRHQTGPRDLDWVAGSYRAAGLNGSTATAYISDMPGAFADADLIISRAGATTLAEIIAARRAAILVPFAGAAEDHQTRNAQELAKVGGAEIIPEDRLTPGVLAGRIVHFLEHPDELDAMERNLLALRSENSADKIAALCFSLMGNARETRP